MLLIPDVLGRAAAAAMRARLEAAPWIDGNATSGRQSAQAKRNRQLDEDSAEARALGGEVLDALAAAPLFVAAALPLRVYPPLFNRYEDGETFGDHVDSAIRIRRGSDFRIRSDLSATLLLSEPDEYEGGDLIAGGIPAPRAAAGSLLLYPADSVHRVTPVTRGVRLAAFFWIQSMVRDAGKRALLLDLDRAVQELTEAAPHASALVRLTGVYHNLLRRWAEL